MLDQAKEAWLPFWWVAGESLSVLGSFDKWRIDLVVMVRRL